jgi:hypothetical protein
MSSDQTPLATEQKSSSDVIDIELAVKEEKVLDFEGRASSLETDGRGIRSASSILDDAAERLDRAMTIVTDAHMDEITDTIEANPTIQHIAPDEATLNTIETKVIEKKKARKTALPAEAQELINTAVKFADEVKEEDGNSLDDDDVIKFKRIQSKATLMVEHTMNTVLERSDNKSKFMQRTLYFKGPALLDSGSVEVAVAESVFERNAPPAKNTDKEAKEGKTNGDGFDGSLAAAAAAAARTRKANEAREKNPDDGNKFGMIDGVMISCLLNIFGVIMFLRLGWVIGQAGIVQGCLIILMSGVVTGLTTMSMAAIATNGKVKGGGAYYMISRALGPEIGGTIGTLFFIGLSVAISIYVIGFCEVLVDNLKVCPNVFNTTTGQLSICNPELTKLTLTGSKLHDIRIWGVLLVTFILVMALFGTGWVIEVQKYLMALLTCTILSVCIGAFVNFVSFLKRLNTLFIYGCSEYFYNRFFLFFL